MAEKPEQANIQGIGIYLVTQNNLMGISQTFQKVGVNNMGEKSASPTNPKMGHAVKRKKHYSDRPIDTSNGD